MINREYQKVNVITFKDEKDRYGQDRRVIDFIRAVEMVCKIYIQSETDSPLFNDVEMIGITKDKDITDANQIQIGTINYNIMHTIPSGKYLQILMKKANN